MKSIKKVAMVFFVIFGLLGARQAFADGQLTIDDAVRTALANHPDIAAASYDIESKKAAEGQAASLLKTQAKANVVYSRSDSSEKIEDTGNYSLNTAFEQSLSDWGRAGLKIKGAKINSNIAYTDYLNTMERVIKDVKTAYYGLNLYTRQYETAKRRYENYEKRLGWAVSYYKAGTKPKIEVTKAQADLAASKLILVQTESAIKQYEADLAHAMGNSSIEIKGAVDALSYEKWNISLEDAIAVAAEKRHELATVKKKTEYAKTILELEKKGLSPNLSMLAGYDMYGVSPFLENSWNAKVTLSVPLLDGGLTKSKVEAAKADLNSAGAKEMSMVNTVVLEVRKAFESLREAEEALSASLVSERSQKETFELASERYKVGVGSSLEISDAIESYAASETKVIKALYDCKQARLLLEKAMGVVAQ